MRFEVATTDSLIVDFDLVLQRLRPFADSRAQEHCVCKVGKRGTDSSLGCSLLEPPVGQRAEHKHSRLPCHLVILVPQRIHWTMGPFVVAHGGVSAGAEHLPG